MNLSDNNIRLIFGLKLKQLRLAKGLSLGELAEKSSLSVSYLNEIENGKKYPKTEKILQLAEALNVSFDHLVSTKLTRNLASIRELLESNILEQLPLDHYGINVNKLLLQISEAPLQLSALVTTLIDLAKNSEASQNIFSKSALRTYTEFTENYFDDLEKGVDRFFRKLKSKYSPPVTYRFLSKILTKEFKYSIDENRIPDTEEFKRIRGVVILEGKSKLLLVNNSLIEPQKTFLVGKEIAYNFLKLRDRTLIHGNLGMDSFEQLLNNLRASYFSTAMIINYNHIVKDIETLFSKRKWEPKFLISLLDKYQVTPEMLFQRISSLLSKYFDINHFFFLRFNSEIGSDFFKLAKEMKLNTKENPGGYHSNEHYCRRWLSISMIKRLESLQKKSVNSSEPIADIQKSYFLNTENEYLVLSIAKRSAFEDNLNYSVSLGILLTENSKCKINFCNTTDIPSKIVNNTCERCEITDCKERAAPKTILEEKLRRKKLKTDLQNLIAEVKGSL